MRAYSDRVKETTTTTGTGPFTLSGAASGGFQDFAQWYGDNEEIPYCVVDEASGMWEVGRGTYTGGNTLSRDLVLDGSSGYGTLNNFPAGTKQVFLVLPAAEIQHAGLVHVRAMGIWSR